jgi:hypothetical protein
VNPRTPLPLLVSLTTLPSRLQHIKPTLDSLITQSRMPDQIFLILPERCDREPESYQIPAWVEDYGPRLKIVRTPRDWGPGAKLIGCIPHLREPACLIVADDDMKYRPFFLEHLHAAQSADHASSFSYYVYRWGSLKAIGQGADGFSFYTPHLEGIERFAEQVIAFPQLRIHDDLWISGFLQRKGISIQSVRDRIPDRSRPYEVVHEFNQLRHLDGDLARDNATARGVHYLVKEGHLGWPLQADHHLRAFAKKCLSGITGKPIDESGMN